MSIRNVSKFGKPGRFLTDRGGNALMEFAFALPVLMVLLLGCLETTRYVLIQQKLDRTSASVADLVAQANTISESEVEAIIGLTGQLMQPYEFSNDGVVFVTSVTEDVDDGPMVQWQVDGAGVLSAASAIGVVDDPAVMPSGFAMRDAETVIVTEVFYTYRPWIFDRFIPEQTIYRLSVRRPRLGGLSTLS